MGNHIWSSHVYFINHFLPIIYEVPIIFLIISYQYLTFALFFRKYIALGLFLRVCVDACGGQHYFLLSSGLYSCHGPKWPNPTENSPAEQGEVSLSLSSLHSHYKLMRRDILEIDLAELSFCCIRMNLLPLVYSTYNI